MKKEFIKVGVNNYVRCPKCKRVRNIDDAPECPICKYKMEMRKFRAQFSKYDK